MKSSKVLDALGYEDDPIDEPVYVFGSVVKQGWKLESGHNHSDYVDKTGYYNITKYIDDHKEYFLSVTNFGIGRICPHVTAEVDCESLFSEANHLALPKHAQTRIRMYKKLVMIKRRLGCIYCHRNDVKDLYIKKWTGMKMMM